MLTEQQTETNQTNDRKYLVPFILITSLFFLWGFARAILDVLNKHFQNALHISITHSALIQVTTYLGYFLMAIPAGFFINRYGYRRGVVFGLLLFGVGALLFIPGAAVGSFSAFLLCLFIIGCGLVFLETAANPYVTIIGPIESAARRISIMGICNKFAGIISPLIFAALILKADDSELFAMIESGTLDAVTQSAMLDELIQRVIVPYAILGVLLLLAGISIRYSVLPEINTDEQNATEEEANGHSNKKSIFDVPYLILGALAIFFHVGTQVIAIDTIINYANSMGMDLLEAKAFPSYTLACTMIGYILGIIVIPKYLSQKNALIICTVLGLFLSFGVVFADFNVTIFGHQANASIFFLNALGFPNALIYAGIWPLSIHGLGRFTKTGSSLLIMGLCGNAILPLIYGYFADLYDLRTGYWVLIPCFLYLVFFAVKGHKITSWR